MFLFVFTRPSHPPRSMSTTPFHFLASMVQWLDLLFVSIAIVLPFPFQFVATAERTSCPCVSFHVVICGHPSQALHWLHDCLLPRLAASSSLVRPRNTWINMFMHCLGLYIEHIYVPKPSNLWNPKLLVTGFFITTCVGVGGLIL